jgi:glycosyltransferase involved in cell wall biosynthesis
MKNLLALAVYPQVSATTRFRVLAYERALQEQGINLVFSSFVEERFGAASGGLGRRALNMLDAHRRRVLDVLRSRRFDAVFIEREANLVGPPWVEHLIAKLKVPVIYDIDDAVWLASVPERGSLRERFPKLGNLVRAPGKGNTLIDLADNVFCGSSKLAAYAQSRGARTTVIPTVPSLKTWKPHHARSGGEFLSKLPIIGWIGGPSTAPALAEVEPALARLRNEGHAFRLVTRGAGKGFQAKLLEAENLPWREQQEPDDFAEIDIGLAPMKVDAWSHGKCAFKQIQYMACAVPYVSTEAGAVDEMVEHNHNGLIAHTSEDWYTHIRALLTDIPLRARLAEAGLHTVQSKYCLEQQEAVFTGAVLNVMGRAGNQSQDRAGR